MSCFFVTPAERAEAQLEAAEAQQQASEKAQEAAEAKRVQDEQAAEKRASDLEEQKEVERQKAAQRAEEQAENAPDNTCRTPSVIGDVMDQMNAMPLIEGRDLQVINVTHITTPKINAVEACAGWFLFSDGEAIHGTFKIITNAAGKTDSRVAAGWVDDRVLGCWTYC